MYQPKQSNAELPDADTHSEQDRLCQFARSAINEMLSGFPEWGEATCKKCGKCCRLKLVVNDECVGLSDDYCQFFDKDTNLCTVYADRLKLESFCLSIPEAIYQRALPNDCAYVAKLKTYKQAWKD